MTHPLLLLFGIAFLLIGIVGLFFSKHMQRYWIARSERDDFPFKSYLSSPMYLVQQKVCGALAFVIALVWIYAAFAGKP